MSQEIPFPQWQLEGYGIRPEYGCLPVFPADKFLLGSQLSFLDKLAERMHELTQQAVFDQELENIPVWQDKWLEGLSNIHVRRALMIYHFLQNICVRLQNLKDEKREKEEREEKGEVTTKREPREIPEVLAVPTYRLTQNLSQKRVVKPPIMSYMSYILDNWRLKGGSDGKFRFDNLEPLVMFNPKPKEGEKDHEAGFILTHVVIEKEAAVVFRAIHTIYHALIGKNTRLIIRSLQRLAESVERQAEIMRGMTDWCGMIEFDKRIRPWLAIFGPEDRVVLKGVGVIDKARKLRGASGAQTAIYPAIDALLGIVHDDISDYPDLLNYIHPEHLRFIQMLYEGPVLRRYILQSRSQSLRNAYDNCITAILRFRNVHNIMIPGGYIRLQEGQTLEDLVGTGGTQLVPWLESLIKDTADYCLD